MIVQMNERIQSVIIAVHSFQKWLYAESVLCGNADRTSGERFNRVKQYFYSLPLPDGMKHNAACFEAVLSYPIEKTLSTEACELPQKFSFGY